ncbi:alpha-L-fucosidase [Sunxiuqinia elliptica]|uniref:alpha-L-fucosidase n=1 Tax=Sunxiuqinia elliptica TaxID=655355 RepID=A0A1I2GQD7_9BACT|nr:alpha-L-fucosidase [Sunxiuqinia elliptica]SFF19682.1 alpha-L-fucosidase [Sunxiuqinia elliptica]
MKKYILIVVLSILTIAGAMAQDIKKDVEYGQYNGLPRQDQAMQKWRENRFGQFIHWGLYAIPGGIWEGKTYPYASEFLRGSAKIATSTWDSLIYQFDIPKYNPKEWAAIAKNMGVKYVTITTKHHEGFCLWPSEYTDFDIENTPYKKDLLREFVDAYTAVGIDVNFYYSVLDWHHPDWRYDIKSDEDRAAFERLKQFTKNQLVELVTRYPEVKGLWFDGTWDNSWKKSGQFSYELEKLLKNKRPGLIVNSRMRADEHGSRHFDSNGILMGDYESGYERRLPNPTDKEVLTRDWECCMTIPENQWGYHKDWSISHVKSPLELIEMLVQCTSQNGNFLLNFGPMGNGDIRPEEREVAKEIGEWMKVNSEAIYGCGPADLEKQDWGYYTYNEKNGKVYMTVFNNPVLGKYKIRLPKSHTLKKASLITKQVESLEIKQISPTDYFIIPDKINNKKPFVIILEIVDRASGKFHQKALT